MNKIVYDDYAPAARENAFCVLQETTQLLRNGVDDYNVDAVFSNTSAYNCVSFDNGGIYLGSPARLMDSGDSVGFVSALMSKNNCTFQTTQKITIQFKDDENNATAHSGNGIALHFNTHYCKKVQVDYYLDNSSAGSLIYSGIDSLYTFLSAPEKTYDKVVITFLETQYPNQRAMVSMIEFGRTIDITAIHSLQYYKKIYYDCSDIAIGTLETTFQYDEELNFFKSQQIRAYHKNNDDDEYSLIGTYWISESTKKTSVIYSIVAEDVFSRLEKNAGFSILGESASDYKYINHDFDDTLEASLLANLDLVSIYANVDYSLQSGIDEIQLYGYANNCSLRKLLAETLFATQLYAKPSPEGTFYVFSLPNQNQTNITSKFIIGDSSFSRCSTVTGVFVSCARINSDILEQEINVYNGEANGGSNTIYVPVVKPSYIYREKDDNGNRIYDGISATDKHIGKIPRYPNADLNDWFVCEIKEKGYYGNYSVYQTPLQVTDYIYEKERKIAVGETENTKKYTGRAFSYGTDYYFEILKDKCYAVVGEVRASIISNENSQISLDVGDYVSIETKHNGVVYGTVSEITGDVGYRDTIQKVVITVWQ